MPGAPQKKTLTDFFLKSLGPAPSGQRPIIWDAVQPHLGVRVTDKGVRTFVVIRRRPGDPQPLRYTIGEYNPQAKDGGQGTLAHARAEARKALEAITQGRHPRLAPRSGNRMRLANSDLLSEEA